MSLITCGMHVFPDWNVPGSSKQGGRQIFKEVVGEVGGELSDQCKTIL